MHVFVKEHLFFHISRSSLFAFQLSDHKDRGGAARGKWTGGDGGGLKTG